MPISLSLLLIFRQNEERETIRPPDSAVNYSTASAYSHVIKDDTIQVEPSNVVKAYASYVPSFNGTMPDRTVKPLSFDKETTDPVVLATNTENDSSLLDQILTINHVFTNNSKITSMSATKSFKTNASNGWPMARPFDEFATDIASINPLDEQSFGTIKSDKD